MSAAAFNVNLLCLLVLCCSMQVGCSHDRSRWLDNPLNQADQVFRWTDVSGWKKGEQSDVHCFYFSDITPASFGFTELLPSWNPADLSAGQGLSFWVCSRDADTQEWSPWLYVGQWGDAAKFGKDRVTGFEYGEVAIDILELQRSADAFRVGVGFAGSSEDQKLDDVLHRMTVVVSGPAEEAHAEFVSPLSEIDQDHLASGAWRRDLAVPFLPQKMLPEPLWSRGCSPTATTMALHYRGLEECLPGDTAEAVYDAEHEIYGNWNRAVAYAGSLGLDAELARFRSWDQLKATIAQGQPVVASIRFARGEFLTNPMGDTDGHLILIRGLTEQGDAIFNDAALEEGGDGIVYKAEELARAWLGKGGVAYLIGERREDWLVKQE